MFPNDVFWHGRSFALPYGDTNHEMLVAHGRKLKNRGPGGLSQKTFLGQRPLERRKDASSVNRIWLVLIIEIYMEKEILISQAGFIEFLRHKTGKGKSPPTSPFGCSTLVRTPAISGVSYKKCTEHSVNTLLLGHIQN